MKISLLAHLSHQVSIISHPPHPWPSKTNCTWRATPRCPESWTPKCQMGFARRRRRLNPEKWADNQHNARPVWTLDWVGSNLWTRNRQNLALLYFLSDQEYKSLNNYAIWSSLRCKDIIDHYQLQQISSEPSNHRCWKLYFIEMTYHPSQWHSGIRSLGESTYYVHT